MNKLVILMSAASALVPASAMAQRIVAPPVKWEDTPRAEMRMPPPAPGVNWHGPAGPNMGMNHGADRMMMRRHGVRNFARYQRFNRGGFLPQTWWGPQFQIFDWSGYGLPQPMPGCRWIRYYDDALMVDGSGRIVDGRWGMNWDRWQDDWDYGDDGAPFYVGNGDDYGRDEAYAWGGDRGYGYGPPPPPPGYAPPPPGYGLPCAHTCTSTYAYPGYGYGWGYGAVVTETTVTTSPAVVTETYYEEEVVRERSHRAKAHKYRAKPRYHRPVPQPGERG
jgi:Ni/Co efflux regulator RcnB